MSAAEEGPYLDLDAWPAPAHPRRPSITISLKAPASLADYIHGRAEAERTTPSRWLRRLVEWEQVNGLPRDVRDWLAIEAQQVGLPGNVEGTLVLIIRHLAQRWPNGARLYKRPAPFGRR